jgi:lipopolysaccharide transport system ATP-binding protein
MGKNIAIKVENLSKAYQLGQIGTGTISRDLERFWATRIRGKEDPFLKIGQINDRTVKGESDIVWSLKDINFEIEQGDAVGIIGRNGAGKSTLLKLLSRVTAPTTGNIKVKGRIASLLEVGTGFHPELTGRENIYLNGAILGMRKKEITRKFDEIVDFSGVERYIDTPVKRYSSGMYVRLAFAVAAHLESEILIIDEVLAVGDAEFQKKCLGKMGEVSKGEGRTVLFVSHNLRSIGELCKNSILLDKGNIIDKNKTEEILINYNNIIRSKNNQSNKFSNKLIVQEGIEIDNIGFIENSCFQGEELVFSMDIINEIENIDFQFNIELKYNELEPATSFGNQFQNFNIILEKGRSNIKVNLGDNILRKGIYVVNIYIITSFKTKRISKYFENFLEFEILDSRGLNKNWLRYIDQTQHGFLPMYCKNINIEQ